MNNLFRSSSSEPYHTSVSQILPQRRRELEASAFCEKLFQNDKVEISKMKARQKKLKRPLLETQERDKANNLKRLAENNCSDFILKRGYFTGPTSTEEKNFPLAFAILMYKHAAQAERLLRAIYSPHNMYCIHVDSKAAQLVHDTMQAIARCFSNVIVIPNPVNVHWGEISILVAERKCMHQLLRRNGKWRYYINLTGEEFPLWSNRHLVRILKAYNGSNDMEYTDSIKPIRYRYVYKNGKRTEKLKEPPPKGVKMVRGEVHIAATRGFVELASSDKNPLSSKFFQWNRDAFIPDEYYYQTLNFNAQVFRTPGGLPSDFKKINPAYGFNARFKIWLGGANRCEGKWQREVCVIGVGDLYRLKGAPQLFVNKFDIIFDPIAYDCAEYFQLNRTLASLAPNFSFNASSYSNLVSVKVRRKLGLTY